MDKFNLKWNEEEDFFDITLIGDDFNHVTADCSQAGPVIKQ